MLGMPSASSSFQMRMPREERMPRLVPRNGGEPRMIGSLPKSKPLITRVGVRRAPAPAPPAVITGHFAKRSLDLRAFFGRQHLAFEHDFGGGGNRQIRRHALDHFHRRATHPAGKTVLGRAPA